MNERRAGESGAALAAFVLRRRLPLRRRLALCRRFALPAGYPQAIATVWQVAARRTRRITDNRITDPPHHDRARVPGGGRGGQQVAAGAAHRTTARRTAASRTRCITGR
ncbi:hypothetical protein Raf01_67030 [Rugosimonospora africana]|uniref:Uncharacterized protein n=1 Tax=Rugosimonospora africana TaxID=556532 RepID=A0A8J3R1L4_9ACTN|nr:hypothetical protein Raf01_67030 [Rugosimonospora africana]